MHDQRLGREEGAIGKGVTGVEGRLVLARAAFAVSYNISNMHQRPLTKTHIYAVELAPPQTGPLWD